MLQGTLRFGPFELDAENFELRRAGRRVKLDKTPLELLLFLCGAIRKSWSLTKRRWSASGARIVFIEAESALYTAIRKIRRALGENSTRTRFVETVARKGYRFCLPKVDRAEVAPEKPPKAPFPSDTSP